MGFIFQKLNLEEVEVYFPNYKERQDKYNLYTYFYLGSQSRRGNLGKMQSYLIIISDFSLLIEDKKNHNADIKYPKGQLQPCDLWRELQRLLMTYTITQSSTYDISEILNWTYWHTALKDCIVGYVDEIIGKDETEFSNTELQVMNFIRQLMLETIVIIPVDKKPKANKKLNKK